MSRRPERPLYGVHPSVAMTQDWVATLRATTGRTLEEWVALARADGPPTEAGRRALLQAEHALGTNSA